VQESLRDAIALLMELDMASAMPMFWYMIVFEVPRYTVGFAVVVALALTRRRRLVAGERAADVGRLKVSIVIGGHNEAGAMRACIKSLGEQTRHIDEIIVVDDGSTDGMRRVLRELRAHGLISRALCNQVRCGKVAACNLGMSIAKGDIVVNLDADCSYDRDAVELLVAPFADPRVGATCGNIGVRNSGASIVAALQAVEYLVSISLGKRLLELLGIVACASGAFSAFRREALLQVGILSSGSGEDLDITLRMRRSGWKIRFVADSWCLTDVPDTLAGLVRQRRRWDRDTFRIRLRRFRDAFNPGARRFNGLETAEQLDFVLFTLITTVSFPLYLLWLFYYYGTFAWTILLAVAIVYVALDLLSFLLANAVSRRRIPSDTLALLFYAPCFGAFNGYFMRFVRLYAYLEEFVFRNSYRDRYVPQRVLDVTISEV
jgi:cellulose synthase/poly-beta-1,6-N-acetylglucosamine synthase-like glycosyltransferase